MNCTRGNDYPNAGVSFVSIPLVIRAEVVLNLFRRGHLDRNGEAGQETPVPSQGCRRRRLKVIAMDATLRSIHSARDPLRVGRLGHLIVVMPTASPPGSCAVLPQAKFRDQTLQRAAHGRQVHALDLGIWIGNLGEIVDRERLAPMRLESCANAPLDCSQTSAHLNHSVDTVPA
jgi:hypothetical protein